MAGNHNHPKKGSSIKVGPIRSEEDINRVKEHIYRNPRNYALFVLGINTNLRISDLLRIKVADMVGLGPGDYFEVREKKTKKHKLVTINKSVHQAIQRLLNSQYFVPGDPLFKSTVTNGPLKKSSVHKMVKRWCRELNIPGNYGTHSLRKTFGYHQRVKFDTPLPVLMVMFNHSNQRQTLNYLGIQDREVQNAYLNEIGG